MKTRIVVTGALLVGLLGGAAGVSAMGMSEREAQVRGGIENCLIAERGAAWHLTADLTATRLSCSLFKIRNGIGQ